MRRTSAERSSSQQARSVNVLFMRWCEHRRSVPEFREMAMAGTCTVDAALFDNLKQAVEFVTERGGGVVYIELAGTKFAESMKLPENVQLKPRRIEDGEKEQAA
jgi:hypothetical protein